MKHIEEILERHPGLNPQKKKMEALVNAICSMHNKGGKLLLCGNGGSASDCEHISGELLKGFLLERKTKEKIDLEDDILSHLQMGISAIPLTSFSSSLTAYSNDEKPELAFAQLVWALGRKEDVFLGISTSGNSQNVVAAAKTAKAMGIITVALTGEKESALSELCDITIKVPEAQTHKIQELHICVYHAICAQCEEILFG